MSDFIIWIISPHCPFGSCRSPRVEEDFLHWSPEKKFHFHKVRSLNYSFHKIKLKICKRVATIALGDIFLFWFWQKNDIVTPWWRGFSLALLFSFLKLSITRWCKTILLECICVNIIIDEDWIKSLLIERHLRRTAYSTRERKTRVIQARSQT